MKCISERLLRAEDVLIRLIVGTKEESMSALNADGMDGESSAE